MNKHGTYIILALIALFLIADMIQKQNRKINGLAYGLSGLQNGVAQNQFAAQVALQQTQEIGQMIQKINTVPFQPNVKREPIGFKTKSNE